MGLITVGALRWRLKQGMDDELLVRNAYDAFGGLAAGSLIGAILILADRSKPGL